MFKVVVFASDEAVFAGRKAELRILPIPVSSILWCNSRVQSRGEFINLHLHDWLLFLDHDCFVSAAVLESVNSVISSQNSPKDTVFSGTYQNPVAASYFQRAHNFIANTWLEQSYVCNAPNKLILGGIFLIFSTKLIHYSDQVLFWGGEDKMLSYALNSQGFTMTGLNGLKVRHETSASPVHFLRRAYLHGKNEVKYLIINKNKINYLFWIRKIGFANASLLPLILLHFCIQRAAVLFQTVLRTNTLQR